MTGNEYQKAAARTIAYPSDRLTTLTHGLLGLASETGELLGIYQKQIQGHEPDLEHVEKEVGDIMWMAAEVCTALGLSLDAAMEKNIEKLRKRYPAGFDPERSLHRAAGDI